MAARLEANEAQRRNLLADVAHELRTPLSVIRGNVEGVLDGLYPADEAHLGPVVEETAVMARLLDDLHTLSTAEAGVLRLHRQRVAPGSLVQDAAAAFRARAEDAGVRLDWHAAPGVPELDVDTVGRCWRTCCPTPSATPRAAGRSPWRSRRRARRSPSPSPTPAPASTPATCRTCSTAS
jgi:signal transduction histidine kinase